MNNGKEEYQKGFRPLGASGPAAGSAEESYSPDEWGTSAMRAQSRSGTINVRAVRDPEGLILISSCVECGGRYEARLSLGALPPASSAISAFANYHRCPEAGHRQTRKVRALIKDALKRAKRSLRKGQQIVPSLSILTSAGSLRMGLEMIFGIKDPEERRIALAESKLAVRQEVRRRGLWVKAAVAISEGWQSPATDWMPPLSRDRQEVVALVVSTAEYSLLRSYPLKRDSGIPTLGPGTLGQPSETMAPESRLLDGLFVGPRMHR